MKPKMPETDLSSFCIANATPRLLCPGLFAVASCFFAWNGPVSHAEPVTVPLTRDGALISAMTHNRAVEVARFGPQIAETYEPEARAEFDPGLLATVSYGRDTRPDLFTTAGGSAGGVNTSSGSGVSSAAALVSAVSRLDDALDALRIESVETENTAMSSTLRNRLPTGTEIFVTGYTDLNDIDPGDDQNVGDLAVGLTQPLLKGAGLKANLVAIRQARNLALQSEHIFRRALLNTAEDVELAYWQLVLAEEVLKIREAAVGLAEEQLTRNQGLLEVGKAIRGDVMAARAERADRVAELATARGELRNRTIDLIHLMNPEGDSKWDVVFAPQDPAEATEIVMDPVVTEKAAMENRPELSEAALDVANLDLDVVRARNQRLPRLDLTALYGRYSAGRNAGDATREWNSDRYDHYSVGIELEVPLLRRAEKARLTRAKLASDRGDAAVRRLELAIAAESRQAVVGVEQQWQRILATRESVLSRGEELRIALGRYEVGKVTNLDVLQVQRDMIEAQVDEATARVGHMQALTRLYAAEGTLLARRGIAVTQDVEKQ